VLQFHEIFTVRPQPYLRGQWDYGATMPLPIPQWFRHVHLKPVFSGCPGFPGVYGAVDPCNVTAGGVNDCNSNAVCASPTPTLLPPFFSCTCPPGWATINFGRDVTNASGCQQCPVGQYAPAFSGTCLQGCPSGTQPDPNNSSNCVDINDCISPTKLCNRDETCINLIATNYSCLLNGLPTRIVNWVNRLALLSRADLTALIADPSGAVVTNFAITQLGGIRIYLDRLPSQTAAQLAAIFSGEATFTVAVNFQSTVDPVAFVAADPTVQRPQSTIDNDAAPLAPIAALAAAAIAAVLARF